MPNIPIVYSKYTVTCTPLLCMCAGQCSVQHPPRCHQPTVGPPEWRARGTLQQHREVPHGVHSEGEAVRKPSGKAVFPFQSHSVGIDVLGSM